MSYLNDWSLFDLLHEFVYPELEPDVGGGGGGVAVTRGVLWNVMNSLLEMSRDFFMQTCKSSLTLYDELYRVSEEGKGIADFPVIGVEQAGIWKNV